jgi:uncharacterized membrane protein YdjX (TVP38/TMEM64 family)
MPSAPESRSKALLRLVGIVAVVLLVPLATLAAWGGLGDAWLAEWQASPPPASTIAAALVALLAADILLPVPSGPLITLASTQLGIVATTWWAWVGLTVGAVAAFAIARWGGPRIATRFAKPDDLLALSASASRNLPMLILVTRPLPMLSEIAVLLLGLLGCRWREFLPSLVIANAIVAAVFAALGSYAADHDLIVSAVAFSIAAPLGLAWWIRRRWFGVNPRQRER